MFGFLVASLWHHRAVNTAVVLGVAVAVAVLAGALLVGASVRDSLREIALRRLGATDLVVSSPSFFRAALAAEIGADAEVAATFRAVAPLIVLEGAVVHEDSQRVAARVQVFGVDRRFGAFHGNDAFAIAGREALLSPALAAELGAAANDSVVLRVARPTDIPLSTLQGRREEAGERIRLVVKTILDASTLGEFSLMPSQGPTLSLFVPIERLQRDLALGDRVNALLVAAQTTPEDARANLVERGRTAIKKHLRLDDLGLLVRPSQDQRTLVFESRAGVIPSAIAERTTAVAATLGTSAQPVLAYLANAIRIGTREVPYSLVAAIDLPSALSTSGTSGTVGTLASPDLIWLNEWAATDLDAKPGDEVTLDYYLWSDERGLSTDSARFTLAGVVPMSSLGGDRTLVPEYPGVTDAADVSTWDPPFPVDLKRVRPKDERYWDDWRTAPKAFVSLAAGQRLWPSAFGSISSLRFAVPHDGNAQQFGAQATAALVASIDPFASGIAVRDARGEALASATGTTDFGEYFVYFSFFLLVAGLLLAGMFFAMGVEQRTREIGLLGALGFPPRSVRSLLLREALVLIALGSVLGAMAAVGYAALIMYGLRTWWVGAVGTTALELHVSPLMLAAGTAGAFVAAIAALRLSLRRLLKRSPRDLLTGEAISPIDQRASSRAMVRAWVAVAFGTIAIAFAAASTFGLMGQVAGFFACGGLLLIAGLTAYSAWLWRVGQPAGPAAPALPARPAPAGSVARLGMQYSRWRPGRSVLSAALIAFACFVLVAVGAFRRDHVGESLARDSGTGGFALMAESVAPLMYDPNTPDGREDLGLPADAPVLANTHVSRFRLRPGDEVSCLTLYRPTSPRIIAPEPRFLGERRFSFAASLASTPEERANPWLLLNRRFDDGAIAAVVDQTSLMYVFHLGLGDDFTFAPEGQPPVRLRIVGALADSVLQSEMIISEEAFVRLFPRHEGYRLWFIQTPPSNVPALATDLERTLSDFGVDTTDTRVRLAAYHQVENTYLSTFQTLGGLGLLVGTLGLAAVLARNVLERRRELGLLGAVGFEPRHLRTIVLAESSVLVGGGLLLGATAALIAVWPALIERAQSLPYASLGLMLLAVAFTGLVAAMAAVRIATATSITDAVKSE